MYERCVLLYSAWLYDHIRTAAAQRCAVMCLCSDAGRTEGMQVAARLHLQLLLCKKRHSVV
jgi:hypothetical protein